MGQLELFAQRTFAEETERITGGAAGWQDPPEIRLEKVTSDGFLVIRQSHLLEHLAAPWPQAQPHGEVMIELKLPGNHLDRKAVERALLRRQAWQVQRLEEQDASWRDDVPEGRLTATRASLRRVLARRQLTPSKDDDARIDACTELATLERWLDRAITAVSVSDVLG